MSRGDGTFKVLAKMGANAYKLELPVDVTVSVTFNVVDLSPYVEDDINFGDLRANPLKGGEDDRWQDVEQASQLENDDVLLTVYLGDQFCEGN